MTKRKGAVRTPGFPLEAELTFVADGYMLPRRFPADYTSDDGVSVHIDVEVEDRQAVARRLTVESANGISSTMLRRVPVRDIVATGCLNELQRVDVHPDGVIELVGFGPDQVDEVREVIQGVVGYSPKVGDR